MAVSEDFERAQVDVKKLGARPGNDVLLKLYALYKQGTQGDASGSRPGMLDLTGRAKFDAWKSVAGTAPEQAQEQYVELVRQLQGR
jgi:diazepam-binding inhibitor (GABA receptor modulating acyl-CoA-binding protein)